jgi:Tfp pilus assembly protein PilO
VNVTTPAGTKLVGALALLLVVGLGWLLVLGPRVDELSETREQVQTMQDQNDTLSLELVRLRRQADDLGATRKAARRLARQIPPTADQPGLFAEVTEAAVRAGIGSDGVTALSPTAPTLGGPDPATGAVSASADAPTNLLARQEVSVSVEGTYAQTVDLMKNLERMDRAYLVTAANLTGEAGRYTTTVVGSMFVMQPVPEP